ncbi:MAG TPA: AAA family ATPase [Candidatus Saccharimonadales bacterium]|nr:AAA family ATPase [Candidatus Saccharimonadales bacterium]
MPPAPVPTPAQVPASQELINTRSSRAAQARFGKKISPAGYRAIAMLAAVLFIAAAGLVVAGYARYACFAGAGAILCYIPAVWWKRQLSILPPSGHDINDRLSGEVLALLPPSMPQNPQTVWKQISKHWQTNFFLNHLLLTREMVEGQLSNNPAELEHALQIAVQLSDRVESETIEVGSVVGGILLASPAVSQMLVQLKSRPEDVQATALWLGRGLVERRRYGKQRFGGIGRDWAFGYTPLLNRFGQNFSLGIVKHGAHFDWLANSGGVKAVEAAFENHASAVALVGPDGIGKTSTVYALAQKLIEGKTNQVLAYHQIIALNATDITSNARGPGDLEHIMLTLANEAAHARHIILFFDDAQLLLGGAPGSFDATQILLSIIQSNAIPIILAFSSNDYQRLRVKNASLANLITPVVLQELPEAGVMRVLEDSALGLESHNKVLISYEALHEAYRLSGRYNQDEAYPGKAIKLLGQSIAHAEHSAVTAQSVQKAIEQTRGVKASTAEPVEADALLHLEDNIHQRMINQSHAVSVVANALRRARAGVTNPKRPIGSFLFLGPTGVGKTELAKAIAATYFGSESAMLRLDMSEYQQPDDVQRLLSTGETDTNSLLMSVRRQPFSVVLLDEIEKAHPNILNLLLQLLDEGQLTDSSGRPASFKDCVIIATSNAGAQTIRERIAHGESLESFSQQFTDQLIQSGQFKPELLNRFDEMVLFRPLNPAELGQVVQLMVTEVNKTLANQNISVELTPAGIQKIVERGNDPRLGARPMRRALQRAVEDTVAQKILRGEARPGDRIMLDAPDLAI